MCFCCFCFVFYLKLKNNNSSFLLLSYANHKALPLVYPLSSFHCHPPIYLIHILSLKHFFSFVFFSLFLDAVEHLRDHVEELGDIGADNRDLDFLRQIFEDPTLLKVVDVSDSFSPL